MKRHTRLLALLLTVVMLMSLLPAVALAAETDTKGADSGAGLEYGIVHLDCGRKYFSVSSIEKIIDAAAAAGMNYVQLAIGNDGMRLLLDDMSLSVNGTTYDSDEVAAAVHEGNLKYNNGKLYNMSLNYNPATNELTESEMNEIIAYAKNVGVGIIPLINTPGHMDAIMEAGRILTGETLSYSGSKTTIDLSNTTAVAFTKAFVQKYIDYFAAKGCTSFNMGTDEYANDVYTGGSMGFGQLVSTGEYGDFIQYVNDMVDMIQDAGMTPMAFNDGVYFNNNKSYGTISTDLVVQYWSSGWDTYALRSAENLARDGFSLINCNGSYYYVVGKNDVYHYTATEGRYHSFKSPNKASEFRLNTFEGSAVSDPAGAAYLIWCDFPAVETEEQVVENNEKIIPVFGGTLPTCAAPKWNGETGTEPVNPTEPIVPVDPTEPVECTDEDTNISVTAPGLTGLTVAETTAEEKAQLTDAIQETLSDAVEEVVAYEVTPKTEDGNYTEAAEVTIPVPAAWESARIRGYVVNSDGSVTSDLRGTVKDNNFTFTVPHFSTLGAYLLAAEEVPEAAETKTVTLAVGETAEYTDNSAYYTEHTNTNSSAASVTLSGNPGREETFTYRQANSVRCHNLINANNNSWQATSYYYKPTGSEHYYPLYAKRSSQTSGVWIWQTTTYTYTWGYSTTDSSNDVTQIGTQSTQSTNTNANITVYTRSAGEPAIAPYTIVTITGVAPGHTLAVVGETLYDITVNALTGSENVAVIVDSTTTLTPPSFVGSGDSVTYAVTDGGGCITVDAATGVVTGDAVGAATVVATVKRNGVTIGTYTYNITVAAEDLSAVPDLQIEYWITNKPLSNDGSAKLSVSAAAAANEEGLSLADIAPGELPKEARNVYFWQGRLLDVLAPNTSTSLTEYQTEHSEDDDTRSGSAFSKVRYYNGAWQVFTTEWVNVDRTEVEATYYSSENKSSTINREHHQLVAYYLEKVEVAQEVETYMADWGKKVDGKDREYCDTNLACSLSFQIVYESGDMNPGGTTAANLANNTIAFHYWDPARGIGTVNIKPIDNFEIYSVTAEKGTLSISGSPSATSAWKISSFDWGINHNDAVEVWNAAEDPTNSNGSVTLFSAPKNPETTGKYANLSWTAKHQAILIRIYVRAKQTADSVTVNYWNRDNNELFHSYMLDTVAGGVFNSGIRLENGELIYNTIPGSVEGHTHAVTANIHLLPSLPLKYLTSSYQVVEAIRSADGKTLDIYYTFEANASFVVDFGLPIYISPEDVGAGDLAGTTVTTHDGAYGVASFDEDTRKVYYTPTSVLKGADLISLDFSKAGDSSNYVLYIYPATTVFYEADFAAYSSDNWTKTASSSAAATQLTVKAGTETADNYGYDAAYAAAATAAYTTTANGAQATFDFKGTGVDLYATGKENSGSVMVMLKDKAGAIQKLLLIDTATKGDYAPDAAAPNTPIATLRGLTHGEYSVTLAYIAGDDTTDGFTFNGFRVYDTMGADTTANGHYKTHMEENPAYYELRDAALAALPDSGDAADIAGQVHAALPDTTSVVFTQNGSTVTTTSLLNDGPKNELYLQPNQSVVFNISTERVAQIGLRSVTGESVSYTINGDDAKMISTSVDMFYDLKNAAPGNAHPVTCTITNNGGGILSISTIKICDDPNGGLAPLTEENLTEALLRMGYATPFQPETFNMKWSKNSITTSTTGTLTITTSKDVASVTVGGTQLRSRTVRNAKTWTYSVREKTAGVYTYDVVAANAEGAEYVVRTPELTVKKNGSFFGYR